MRRHALPVAHDDIGGLGGEVAYEVDAVVYAAQLVEERLDAVVERVAARPVGDNRVYHVAVALDHGVELVPVLRVARGGQMGGVDQFIGDAAQRGHHHDDRFVDILDDLLQIKYALGRTHGGASEFQYSHFYFVCK